MTYTKRQFFIYRLKQCIKLIDKTLTYLKVVRDYSENSKYGKRVKKIENNIRDCFIKLNNFLKVVDSKEVG